jgi:uncharacterized repeat protein (TIGR01451 family)
MRLPLTRALAALLFVFAGLEALAAIRITDLQGREVTIYRGPAPAPSVAAKSRRIAGNSITTVNAGPDIDAANNDYRRIQNALNAAASGDTIILSGTFDFTQPFAAAAWALGNDNTASTGDDYEVLVPAGLNNVTLTATSLGSATIQGPGDLAAVNLEAFLVFDASLSGASQGWTISNLRILDFDLSIGMFAVSSSDYNNTKIQNNFIRIPTDLNATVAPADVNQNIGINFSFGTNQSITGNSFQIPGDGVSDSGAGNFSTSVVMQSNTSGGSTYDGLNISNNVTHILNAQSANPQVTLGIWENGQAHTSNITVSNNSFINDAAGNSPSLNIERAFRVTSHSGASSTVTYDSNQASGANIGFQWIAGSNFAGNQAVLMTNNQISNCDTGVLIQSNGIAHFADDVITGSGAGGGIQLLTGSLTGSGANTNGIFQTVVSGGSADGVWVTATAGAVAPMSQNDLSGNTGFGLRNDAAPQVVATPNWWGSNLAASVAAEASGNINFDPWLASGTDVNVPTTGFQPFIYATTSGTLTTLAGTAAADTGSALAGNPITLMMDGDTATIPLAQLLNLTIQLGNSDDVFTLGQLGVPTTFDGGAGNDTLIGTNVAQTWNITGAGSGNIPGAAASFTGVEALRGGSAADSFVFGAAGGIALTVDGGLGIDTLDNTAIPGHTVTPTGPGTLDGLKGTATGIGTAFDNINVIAGNADVSITKTAGPPPYGTSAPLTYTIVVANAGPSSATGVVVTDILPAGVSFISATPTQGNCSGTTTVTCNLGTIANAATATISLQVTLPSTPGPVSNTATVATSSTDPNPANNSSTSTITVIPAAQIPAASPMLLLLLAMTLGVLGLFAKNDS